MKLKDFILSDDFYSLGNKAKLLYFYLAIMKDNDGYVNSNLLIRHLLYASDTEYNQLLKTGLIEMNEDGSTVRVLKEVVK